MFTCVSVFIAEDLLQTCSCGGRGIVEDMFYESRRAEDLSAHHALVCVSRLPERVCCCLLLQYLIQNCASGGRRIVENMCYEIQGTEACVD